MKIINIGPVEFPLLASVVRPRESLCPIFFCFSAYDRAFAFEIGLTVFNGTVGIFYCIRWCFRCFHCVEERFSLGRPPSLQWRSPRDPVLFQVPADPRRIDGARAGSRMAGPP